jgi:AraC-like DNA-binding protein/mannose-6-phosphate isomerase-like protein (cupin superfamily)
MDIIELTENEKLCKYCYESGFDLEALIEEGAEIPSAPGLNTNGFSGDHMTELARAVGMLREDFLIPAGADVHVILLPRYLPVRVHSHSFIEFIYVCRGNPVQFINGEEVKVREGDLFVLSPGTTHLTRVYSDEGLVYFIMIRKSTFRRAFISLFSGSDMLSEFFAHTIFGKASSTYMTFNTAGDEKMQEWIGDMYKEAQGRDNLSSRMLNTAFEWLCLQIIRKYVKGMGVHGSDADVRAAKLLLYISEHFGETSLTEMAEKFGYSTGYLCRLIKKVTGQNYSELVQRIRLERACELLENSDIEVGEIAEEIGFADTSNFHRAFRKFYGTTPARYRKDLSLREKRG